MRTIRMISRFFVDESAATSIEYAVVAGCIALALIGVVKNLGTKTTSLYLSASSALK